MLDIWGEFEIKALLNAALKDTMLDKELTQGDAFRPYLEYVLRLTVKNIVYGQVPIFSRLPGFDNIAGFNERGFLNKLWSAMYDTDLNPLILDRYSVFQ